MNSLVEQDTQLRLTTADMPNEAFAKAEAKGDYTAERLFHHRRQEYDLIMRMLGEQMSVVSIARIMKVAEKTVAAVRDRECALLPTPDLKVAMGQRWAGTFHIAQDIIQEIAADPKRRKKVSLKDAAIAGSIATQNHQLLSGEATGRVEHVDRPSEHNDLEDYLQRFRAGVVEVESTPLLTPKLTEATQVTAVTSEKVS